MLGIYYSFHDDGQNGFYCKENAFADPSETLLKIDRCLSENRPYTLLQGLLAQHPNPFKGKNLRDELICYTNMLLEESSKITAISQRILAKHTKPNAVHILRSIGWYGDDSEAEQFLETFNTFLKNLIESQFIPKSLVVYVSEEDSLLDIQQTVQKIKSHEDWLLNSNIQDKLSKAIKDENVCRTQCYELLLTEWYHGYFECAILSGKLAIVNLFLRKNLRTLYRHVGLIGSKFAEDLYQRKLPIAQSRALDHALENGNDKIIDRLIEAGFSIEFCDLEGLNALARAIIHRLDAKVIQKLLDLGAKIEVDDCSSFTLTSIGNWPAMRLLAPSADLTFNHQARIDFPKGARKPATSIARLAGTEPEVAKALKAAKRNLNFKDRHGIPPLLYAVLNLNLECAQHLLEGGADPNFPCHVNNLYEAAKEREWEMVNLLLKYGAKVDVEKGTSLLERLCRATGNEANAAFIKVLTEQGCGISEEIWIGLDDAGRTRLRPLIMHRIP